MEISENGLDLIKKFEGFRSEPYRCSAGVPTIGYGTTHYPDSRAVRLDDSPITEAQAEVFLRSDVSKCSEFVTEQVSSTLNQNQFDALVSFTYNLGSANLERSTLLKKLNDKPDDKRIAEEFMRWVYARGRKLEGLVRRRKAEADLYFS